MLIDHLEDYLGEIATGWMSECGRFQVVLFHEAVNGADAYVTLGVSRSGLALQEYLLLAPPRFRSKNLHSILMHVAAGVLDTAHALDRGGLVRGFVAEGFPFRSLYVTLPVYLPESFAVTQDGAGNEVAIRWLVPILPEEVRIVETAGWSFFEDLLEQQDPDLTDFARDPVSRGNPKL